MRGMEAQESGPPQRGRSTSLDHVLGDAGLSGLKAELPQLDADLRGLIRRMSADNPLWGAPQIHGELLLPWSGICNASSGGSRHDANAQ